MTAAMCSNQQQKAMSGSPLLSPPTNHSKFCSFVPITLPIGDYFIFSEDKILNQIERDLFMNFKKKKNWQALHFHLPSEEQEKSE